MTDQEWEPVTSLDEAALRAEVERLRQRLAAREAGLEALPAAGSPAEDPFAALVRLLPDALFIVGADGRFLYLNEAGARLLGAPHPEDVLERSFAEFLRREDVQPAREHRRRLLRGERVEIEEQQVVRLTGEAVPVESAAVPIRYRGEAAVLLSVRDLSARRHLESAVVESEALFHRIFQESPVALCLLDAERLTLLEANDRFYELVGMGEEALLGRRFPRLFGCEDALAFDASVAAAGLRNHLLVLCLPQGRQVQALVSVQPLRRAGAERLLLTVQDVTVQEEALHGWRESERRFRHLADAAPVMIWQADSDLQFEYVNAQWSAFRGRPVEEELGTGWQDGLPPEQRGPVLDALRARVRQCQPIRQEVPLLRADGALRGVLFIGVPRADHDGSLLGYVGSCFDLTERLEAEAELRRAKVEAEEMARLKASILSNITHEVRTPLTVILGFTSILRQGVRDEYQRFVSRIERSGRRLMMTLDAVLDLAQLESGTLRVEPQAFNVGDLVQTIVGEVQAAASEKGVEFKLKLPPGNLYAQLDHRILSRILVNLLDNAIKFTPEGMVELKAHVEGESLVFEVRDTGIGIEEVFLPHVFDEFTQESMGLERTYQGSGLGLTVSRRLAQQLGGEIHVSSEKGKGSTFTLRIPRTLEPA